MERNAKIGILNVNLWLLIGAVFFCLIGLAGFIFSLFPDIEPIVSKDSLQSKEVTVSELDYHIRYRSANTYYIRTIDGEKYIISGSFDRYELVRDISVGKTITVEWYQTKFPTALLAEEVFVDGKQVVFYDNNEVMDWKITFFMGCIALLMGAGCFAAIRHDKKLSSDYQRKGKGSHKRKNKKKS